MCVCVSVCVCGREKGDCVCVSQQEVTKEVDDVDDVDDRR